MSDNKKTLVLSIVGVLVLVLVVVGVSYAMYTFTGTGTKQNTISTGSISVTIDPTQGEEVHGVTVDKQTITLTNQYPMTDAEGTKSSEVLRFYVAATVSGSTTINYEVGMAKDAASTLQDNEVKVNLKKVAGTGSPEWKKGTANTGVLVSTFAATSGTLPNTTVTNYLLDSGSFTASGIVTYEMQMWVDENYDLPTTDTSTGLVHSNGTTSETYSFKVKAFASQAA